ncbi:MAG: WG repeat-containing protein [Christensenellales bacterium]
MKGKKFLLSLFCVMLCCACTTKQSEYLTPVHWSDQGETHEGYMDEKGNMKIEGDYGFLDPFNPDGKAVVIKKTPEGDYSCYGLMDKQGNVELYPDYEYMFYNSESGLYEMTDAKTGIKHGFMDGNGNIKVPCRRIILTIPYEGKMVFAQKEKAKIMDTKTLQETNIQTEMNIDRVGNLYERVFPFSQESGGKWGIMDIYGNVILEDNKYDYIQGFYEGFALGQIYNKKKWDVIEADIIDKQGNVIRSFHTSVGLVQGYKDGVAILRVAEQGEGAIDTKGNWILEPKYFGVQHNQGVLTAWPKEGGTEFYDLSGKLLLASEWNCLCYRDGYIVYEELHGESRSYAIMDIKGQKKVDFPEGYSPSDDARVSKYSFEQLEKRKFH